MENTYSLQPTPKTSTGSNDPTKYSLHKQQENVKQRFSVEDDFEYSALIQYSRLMLLHNS